MLVERVEPGMHLQQRAAGGHETAKGGGTLGAMRQVPVAKIAKQQLENFELELGDAPVVDERRRAQLLQSAGELRARRLGHAPRRSLETPAPPARRCTAD